MRDICALVAAITDDESDEDREHCHVEELGTGLSLVSSREGYLERLYLASRGPSEAVEVLALLDENFVITQVQHNVEGVRVETSDVAGRQLVRVVVEAENTPARKTIDEATWRQERTAFCVRDSNTGPPRCHLVTDTRISMVDEPGADIDYALVAAVHEGELRLHLSGLPACTCIRHPLW